MDRSKKMKIPFQKRLSLFLSLNLLFVSITPSIAQAGIPDFLASIPFIKRFVTIKKAKPETLLSKFKKVLSGCANKTLSFAKFASKKTAGGAFAVVGMGVLLYILLKLFVEKEIDKKIGDIGNGISRRKNAGRKLLSDVVQGATHRIENVIGDQSEQDQNRDDEVDSQEVDLTRDFDGLFVAGKKGVKRVLGAAQKKVDHLKEIIEDRLDYAEEPLVEPDDGEDEESGVCVVIGGLKDSVIEVGKKGARLAVQESKKFVVEKERVLRDSLVKDLKDRRENHVQVMRSVFDVLREPGDPEPEYLEDYERRFEAERRAEGRDVYENQRDGQKPTWGGVTVGYVKHAAGRTLEKPLCEFVVVPTMKVCRGINNNVFKPIRENVIKPAKKVSNFVADIFREAIQPETDDESSDCDNDQNFRLPITDGGDAIDHDDNAQNVNLSFTEEDESGSRNEREGSSSSVWGNVKWFFGLPLKGLQKVCEYGLKNYAESQGHEIPDKQRVTFEDVTDGSDDQQGVQRDYQEDTEILQEVFPSPNYAEERQGQVIDFDVDDCDLILPVVIRAENVEDARD